MRLARLAHDRGIDAFQFDDFLFVGKHLAQDPKRLILVGGQALETWGHVFDVVAPTGEHAPLTEDTDFLGSPRDAKWLCQLLGRQTTELILAKDFDPSVSSAIAYIETADKRILMIDFLKAIVGVSNDDISRTAVPITVAGVQLNVLHPLYCLRSRLANLEKLPSKRNTNGVMQAEWSIDIVHAWLLRYAAEGASQRDMINAIGSVVEAAEYQSGPYCLRNYRIDPLRALTDDVLQLAGDRFVAEDWPRRRNRVNAKRAAMMARYKFSLPTSGGSFAIPTAPPDARHAISQSSQTEPRPAVDTGVHSLGHTPSTPTPTPP